MTKSSLILILFLNSFLHAQIFQKVDLEKGITFVTELITSEEFLQIRNSSSDLIAIDSLFSKTKKFYNDDIEESLLALTFGTLPYYQMPLILPFFHFKVTIPLPTPQKNLNRRIKNLPSHFLFDSPKNDFGDNDKLAHFFGNAYLEYSLPLFNVSDFMSIFVEKFEESFKVEGALDKRDIFVNRLGKKFGNKLRNNKNFLPSEVLSNK